MIPYILRKRLLGTMLGLIAQTAIASGSFNFDGYSSTIGPVTNRSNLNSSLFNPANGRQMVADDESLRFGLMPNLGLSLELGEVGKLKDLQDSVQKDLDGIKCKFDPKTAVGIDPKAIINQYLDNCLVNVRAKIKNLNANSWKKLDVLDVQLQLNGGIPLTPLVYRATPLSNAWTLSDSVYVQSRLRILTSDLALVEGERKIDLLNPGASNIDLKTKTDTAYDVTAAAINRLSLGYSLNMNRFAPVSLSEDDSDLVNLDAGLRFNYYSVRAGRSVKKLLTDNKIDASSPTFETRNSGVMGLDWGLLWTSTHYQLGATIYNLNGPQIDYPDVDIPLTLKDKASASGKVTLKPQTVLEYSLYNASKTYQLQASYALNKTQDFIGADQQWATLSTGVYTDSYWLPSVRLGYQKNLAGTQLSRIGLGFTFLGVLNLDAFTSVEKSEDVPRALGFALSLTEKF